MVADELAAAAAVLQPLRHRHPNRVVFSRSGVAARKPHDGVVLVARAEEFPKDVRVLLIENFFRMVSDVPRLGGHQAHHQTQFVRAIDHVVHVLEKLLVGPGRVAVDQRCHIEERRIAVRMFPAKSAQHVRLDDREPFGGAVLEILIEFIVVEPLEKQPASVAEIKERLAVLINEVSSVLADAEFDIFDGTRRHSVRRGGVATNGRQQRCRQRTQCPEPDGKRGCFHDLGLWLRNCQKLALSGSLSGWIRPIYEFILTRSQDGVSRWKINVQQALDFTRLRPGLFL